MKHMGTERGFSLIGMLIAAVIVSILVVMQLQTLGFSTGGDNTGRNALGMDLSKTRVRQLHQAEMTYFAIHRSYGTWAELVQDGQIPRGYTASAGTNSVPWVPYHDVEIELTDTGFIITATPNIASGAAPGSPILRIDQSGVLEEVQP